ncbi:putative ribosomal N-acetyltransferase YdaF [termite gut metagenome]|uniref:Putative ribosomal N-acetyltransferase YdaF n=1 Tax=termite gut metagenome TaxID=433724 RepID=A0A5J4Q3L8_9ZZZZ
MYGNIKTDRLIMRIAKSDDAEAIFSYRSDFIENKYQGWLPDSVDEVRDYINNMPQTIDVADTCFQFTIISTNENRLIGDMGISFTGHDKMQAEIGCTLHKDFQGKGYATEALKAMVNYLFVTLKKHRVIASIDPRNTASIRLIERLGFRKEAHFKESYSLRGEWVDDIIYAMLRKEWSNKEIK